MCQNLAELDESLIQNWRIFPDRETEALSDAGPGQRFGRKLYSFSLSKISLASLLLIQLNKLRFCSYSEDDVLKFEDISASLQNEKFQARVEMFEYILGAVWGKYLGYVYNLKSFLDRCILVKYVFFLYSTFFKGFIFFKFNPLLKFLFNTDRH